MENNILITSAGKRVSLVKIFQKTIKKLGINSNVYTTELNASLSPAAIISDKCFNVPKVTDNNYVNILIDICAKNNIKIIIPTIDTELLVLSQSKKLFNQLGIYPIISTPEFISICRDKRKTNIFFNKLGIKTPKPIDISNPIFPLFAKPYDGSLSQNTHIIHNHDELTTTILNDEKLMFMEYINKDIYKEFTIDMYYGKDNLLKSIVPRERIEIRAGEINKGITRKNSIIPNIKKVMNYIPGVSGCICLQLFYNNNNDDIVAIEINPRFGGGYPLSYHAGANFAEYIIKEYIYNQVINYNENWQNNTLMLRYDNEIIINNAII